MCIAKYFKYPSKICTDMTYIQICNKLFKSAINNTNVVANPNLKISIQIWIRIHLHLDTDLVFAVPTWYLPYFKKKKFTKISLSTTCTRTNPLTASYKSPQNRKQNKNRIASEIESSRGREITITTMAATTPFNGIGKSVSRTVLITGVSRGLGRALAQELAKRGHTVIGCSRTQDKLTSLQSELPNPDHHLFLNVDIVSTLSASSLIHSFNCYYVKLYE